MRYSHEDYDEAIKRAKKAVEEARHTSYEQAIRRSELNSSEQSGRSCGVITVRDGEILAAIRKSGEGYGKICGPGGGIHDSESPIEGAKRELEEEFGLKAKSICPLCNSEEETRGEKPYLFLCTKFEGEPDCKDGELESPMFLSMEELAAIRPSCFNPFYESIEYLNKALRYDDEETGEFEREEETEETKGGERRGGDNGGGSGSYEEYDRAIKAAIESQKQYSHEEYDKAIARALGVNGSKNKREKNTENILTSVRKSDSLEEKINSDAEDDHITWVTIKGTHVPLDGDGNVIGGALEGQNFSEAKSGESSKESTAKGSEHSKASETKTGPETESKGSEESGKQESETEKTVGVESTARMATGSFGGRTPEEFSPALTKAKAAVKTKAESNGMISKAWRVSDLSPEDIKKYHPGAKLHITEGGSTVATDEHHDIFGVCHVPGDSTRGADLLKMAVEAGGDRLDSFDGNHDFYLDNGFEPISWCEFSLEDAPPDYTSIDEKERVIFYRYNKDYTDRPTLEEFCTSKTKGVNYDNARDIRNDLMDKK